MVGTGHNDTGAIVVVYDGSCAFCRRSIAAIQQRDRHGQFIYLPRETSGLDERYPQLALGDFDTGMRVIEPDGTMHVGADAIYQIATRLPYFRRSAWMYHLPYARGLAKWIYAWVAANRMKLSRYCGETCGVSTDVGHVDSIQDVRTYIKGPKFLISIVILLVVGLHITANLARTINESAAMGLRSWPFLAYGMYRKSHGPGIIRATKHDIVGVTARGEELAIAPNIVGLQWQALYKHYVNPMRGGNPSAARRLADRINVDREDPIIAFRAESATYTISESGIVREGQQPVTYSVER